MQKSLLTRIGEAIDQHRNERQAQPAGAGEGPIRATLPRLLRWFLPNGGTLLLVAILIFTQNVWAGQALRNLTAESAASTGTIAYQGRLADSSGNPLTSTLNMSFRLYAASTGGAPLWSEQWTGPNGVKVSDGLFNVMLGSLTPIPQSVITGNANIFLGITVGTDDEMTPRVQLGSVPFAVQALTVPDGSITAAKLAADVSLVPPAGSITSTMLADGAVTARKLNLVSGNFGIGTAEPNANLEVSSPGQTVLRITTSSPTDNEPKLQFYSNYNSEYERNWEIATSEHGVGDFVIRTSNAAGDAPGVTRLMIDRVGDVTVGGSFRAGGTKSAVVDTESFGQRKLYAVEAPDVRFSDEGMAHLQGGQARVELEPIFLETIKDDYLIQITPYGDASLYVAEIGADYFVVKAREGDPNVSFAWRLSATRKGYAGVRLEEATATD